MRCPPDGRHRSVCCGFKCTYVSSSNAKSIVWVLTKYTRNPTSDRRSDARIYCYQTYTSYCQTKTAWRQRTSFNTHIKRFETKTMSMSFAIQFCEISRKKGLLLEGPQALIVLVGSAYRRRGVGRTGRMKRTGVNRMTWRTRPCANLPTEKINMD